MATAKPIRDQVKTISPKDRKQWRNWLLKNHLKEESVWVIFNKKSSQGPVISWSDAVDEALCFGWIDSQRNSIDDKKFMQRYSRRKPNSMWSKVNKQKVARLTKAGLMTDAGLKAIETAKRNGSWSLLDEVEELTIPDDLSLAFKKAPGSKKIFLAFSRSKRRLLLVNLVMAKRPETRAKRIIEILEVCSNHEP